MAPSTPYGEFVGKKIVLTRNLDQPNDKGELAEEIEGTLEAANDQGILFKPKGKVKPDIIVTKDIEDIRYAPEKAKNLKAKTLKPITYGQARSHLLERHGMTLSEVNAMTEEQAFKYHQELDHVAAGLGHVHGEKESPAAEAVADEEAAADSDESAA